VYINNCLDFRDRYFLESYAVVPNSKYIGKFRKSVPLPSAGTIKWAVQVV